MTLIDDDLDTDIARMLTIAHNRRTLGYGYYEHNPAASRQTHGKRIRNTKSRAGQPGWRTRWPAPPRPERINEADLLEHTLTFAHAGLDLIEGRRT